MCELQQIVGFQKEVRNGIVFTKNSTIFYIAGQTGIFHNLKRHSQKFLPINEKNVFTAMALGCINLLALASKGSTPKLMIYNLKSRESYTLPNPNLNNIEYIYLSFSGDNEILGAQCNFPSWTFSIWKLETRSILATFLPFRLELGSKVLKFAFDPKDNTNIVAIGRYFFRIYQFRSSHYLKEEALHELERSQKTYHSLTWIQKTNKYAVATSDGIILIFERKCLIQQVFLDKKLADVPRILKKIRNPGDKNITCILSSRTGLICSYGRNSVLCLNWKVDKKDFNIVSSVHIPKRVECGIEESKIVQLILNSVEDLLVACTDDGQILTFSFKEQEHLENIGYEAEFDAILDQQHKMPLICADTSVNRPVHVTCSKLTLILWDYQTRKLLLWKKFENEIRCVSIHPLGIHLSVGFHEYCKMYNILHDKLEEIQHFETKMNSQVRFSEGGQMLALANVSSVELYLTLSFDKYAEFIGHKGEIKCVLWKANDNHLISLDETGGIYQWDVALKKKAWHFYENPIVFSTIAIVKDLICATTMDSKILMFQNYMKTAEVDTQIKGTSMLITQHLLFHGSESGMLKGYILPLNGDTLFENSCHQGAIVNIVVRQNGRLLLVSGEDGCMSMWKITCETDQSIPLFDEVLIEKAVYESNLNKVSQLEKALEEKSRAAEVMKAQQLQLQEAEKAEFERHYKDIQNQLKQKTIELTEEKYNLQINMEKINLDEITEFHKERYENYSDFQLKLEKEEDNFSKLVEDRANKVETYDFQLHHLKEEIETSNERVEQEKKKNEMRLKELESALQEELATRQKDMKENEKFYENLEVKAKELSDETNLKFASDLKNARLQNQFLMSEVERINAMLDYEKECAEVLNAEFGKKKGMYDGLKEISKHIKNRISQIESDILRKDTMIKDKVSMVKELETHATEVEHMSSESNWRLEECNKQLKEKSDELSKLSNDLEELKTRENLVSKKLKMKQREQYVLDERLKATEKSIADSTQKLLKSRLLLERYRREFIDTTKDINSPLALRWALLKLLDKRVLRGRVRVEELHVADIDPLKKFCRERDHYESLLNTVLNRNQEIQTSFRSTYVKLAKENSDWTAFSEAILTDIKQKQEKIQTLEEALKLPAKDFLKEPSDTQKRFKGVYKNLKQIETKENVEIQKRMDFIEMQMKELQRLHGLLVVEERGRIVRKIGY